MFGIEEDARAEARAAGRRAAARLRTAARATWPSAMRRSGDAGHQHVAVGEHDVVRRALEHLGADQPRLVRDLARPSARTAGPATAATRLAIVPMPKPTTIGVAAADDHALERHAELVGADLGQRRLVRLALRADADMDEDDAARDRRVTSAPSKGPRPVPST